MDQDGVVKRSVRIAGHATSVSLERRILAGAVPTSRGAGGSSVAALVAAIDAARGGNLSSAIRLFVLDSARRGELGAELGEGEDRWPTSST